MAERLAVGAAVHGQMLRARLCGHILLPERGGSLAQHAAPIGAHLAEHLLMVAHHAECLQLVEAHIGRGDRVYGGV